MFYIFDINNKCIGSCSQKPDQRDLDLRNQFFKESEEDFDISTLKYEDDFIVNDVENEGNQLLSVIEHSWVKSELKMVDTELMYHWTGDITRQSYTEEDWKLYAIALRDYTTIVDGAPVINADSRPISPHNTTLEE